MIRPRDYRRGGFTLLEAVLALAILSAVMVVCLGMRSQALGANTRLSARHAEQRDTQAIFDMVSAGLMPNPIVDKESGARRWRGEYLGAEYELAAQRVNLPNPVASLPAAAAALAKEKSGLSERMFMWRYELKYRGRTSEFLWHR